MNDPALIQKLDLSEQRMLKEGLKAHDALNEWLFKLDPKLKPADTVVNLKKRKLLDSESK